MAQATQPTAPQIQWDSSPDTSALVPTQSSPSQIQWDATPDTSDIGGKPQIDIPHPFPKAVGDFALGAASEVGGIAKNMVNPMTSGLLGAAKDIYEKFQQLPPIYREYEKAKASGSSFSDAISAANQEAKRQQEAHDFITERLKEFKDNPARAAGKSSIDLTALVAPFVHEGGLPSPEEYPNIKNMVEAGKPRAEAGAVQQEAAARIKQTQGEAVGAAKEAAMPEDFTMKLGPATKFGQKLASISEELGSGEGLESLKDPEVSRVNDVVKELSSTKTLDKPTIQAIKDQLQSTIEQMDRAVRNGTAKGTALGYYKQIRKAFDDEVYNNISATAGPAAAAELQEANKQYAQTIQRQTKGPANPLFKAKTPEKVIKLVNSPQMDGTTIGEFLQDKTPEEVESLRNGAMRDLVEKNTQRGKEDWPTVLKQFEAQRDAAKTLYGSDYDAVHDSLTHLAKRQEFVESAKALATRLIKYAVIYDAARKLGLVGEFHGGGQR